LHTEKHTVPDGQIPTTHLSIRAPGDIVTGLDRVAGLLDRDRSWVVLRALRQYLDREGREVIEDAAALAALDHGGSVPFTEILRDIDEIITGAPRRKARPKRR
jgi:predicted transcriptional regulator